METTQENTTNTATDDWKKRYRAPQVHGATIAGRAPDRGLASTTHSGVLQIYAWDVPSGELRQLTDRPTGVAFGTLAPDGRYVYYLDDKQGNEIGHFVRVPWDGGPAEDVTPDMPLYASWQIVSSRLGNRLAFTIGAQHAFEVYALELDEAEKPGQPRLLYSLKTTIMPPVLSYDGAIIAVQTSEMSGSLNYNLLALDADSGERLNELSDGPGSSMRLMRFAPLPEDTRVLAVSDKSGRELPLIWDARSGERFDLPVQKLSGDVYPWGWSPDGGSILLCQLNQAVQQLYIYNIADNTLQPLQHIGGSYQGITADGSFLTPDGEILMLWQDSAHAPEVRALDPASGEVVRTLLKSGEMPAGRSWRSISFPSSDGTMIQGWLALPGGNGPFPTILETHGGPTAAVTDVFSPGSQGWLDAGFAYLTINYRGSTTFGSAFEKKIWGDIGHWEVEDMVAARDWLVVEGIAQRDAIFLTGRSYGGYLTLLAAGKRPELWAGGMAVVAIADWVLMYRDQAPTLRGYQLGLFGGTPEEQPEQYASASPVTYVEKVNAPLLIIQAQNDTRCPPQQMIDYVDKLRALNKPVELVWFDAGHGSLDIEQMIGHHELMENFATKVLAAKNS